MIDKCNCRDKVRCPLEGKCKQECVVYKVEVYTDSNNKRDKKISHERYRYSTALSSYVWEIKEKMGVDPIMKWEVIKKCRKYRAGNRTCNLCMEEKLIIADCKSKNMLNKRSEVLNSCIHKRAWLLYN